eukprot:TRINITY_DN1868_c0_g1_i1.p1 TRINITY_DN1868_c0_g1~~TRINITY_DN1868_c0_g1_i1.p1  ORF type:complete len:1232 (+),score=179.32 TRINITY_DN1868_c0_g1_i1:140-3835(+)
MDSCSICGVNDPNEYILSCVECKAKVHANCVGEKVGENWKCFICRKDKNTQQECAICQQSEHVSPLLMVESAESHIHGCCALWHPDYDLWALVSGKSGFCDPPIINSKSRIFIGDGDFYCACCGKSSGVLIKCSHEDCELFFHPSCALDRSLRFNFKDKVSLTCDIHSPSVAYCICRKHNESEMIECSLCCDWFHSKCLGLDVSVSQITGKFSCPRCSKSSLNDMPSVFKEMNLKKAELEHLLPKGPAPGQSLAFCLNPFSKWLQLCQVFMSDADSNESATNLFNFNQLLCTLKQLLAESLVDPMGIVESRKIALDRRILDETLTAEEWYEKAQDLMKKGGDILAFQHLLLQCPADCNELKNNLEERVELMSKIKQSLSEIQAEFCNPMSPPPNVRTRLDAFSKSNDWFVEVSLLLDHLYWCWDVSSACVGLCGGEPLSLKLSEWESLKTAGENFINVSNSPFMIEVERRISVAESLIQEAKSFENNVSFDKCNDWILMTRKERINLVEFPIISELLSALDDCNKMLKSKLKYSDLPNCVARVNGYAKCQSFDKYPLQDFFTSTVKTLEEYQCKAKLWIEEYNKYEAIQGGFGLGTRSEEYESLMNDDLHQHVLLPQLERQNILKEGKCLERIRVWIENFSCLPEKAAELNAIKSEASGYFKELGTLTIECSQELDSIKSILSKLDWGIRAIRALEGGATLEELNDLLVKRSLSDNEPLVQKISDLGKQCSGLVAQMAAALSDENTLHSVLADLVMEAEKLGVSLDLCPMIRCIVQWNRQHLRPCRTAARSFDDKRNCLCWARQGLWPFWPACVLSIQSTIDLYPHIRNEMSAFQTHRLVQFLSPRIDTGPKVEVKWLPLQHILPWIHGDPNPGHLNSKLFNDGVLQAQKVESSPVFISPEVCRCSNCFEHARLGSRQCNLKHDKLGSTERFDSLLKWSKKRRSNMDSEPTKKRERQSTLDLKSTSHRSSHERMAIAQKSHAVSSVRDKMCGALKTSLQATGFENDHLETLASQIEANLAKKFEIEKNPTVLNPYKSRCGALMMGLRRNTKLSHRLLTGTLDVESFIELPPEELVSEEEQKHRASIRNQYTKENVMLISEDTSRHLRKTHKGFEELDTEDPSVELPSNMDLELEESNEEQLSENIAELEPKSASEKESLVSILPEIQVFDVPQETFDVQNADNDAQTTPQNLHAPLFPEGSVDEKIKSLSEREKQIIHMAVQLGILQCDHN